jgi:Outer membrane lipoprotein carrier protein LolA-like
MSLACALAMAQASIRSGPASTPRAPEGVPTGATAGAGSLTIAIAPAADPAGEAGPTALDEVLRLLAARHEGHVTFTEVHTLAMLDRPLESSGELLYEAPDHLEKRTLKPKPEDLRLDHGLITVQRGSRTRTLELSQYPQAVPFVECLRATLAGDRAALERYFRVQFSGSLAHWTLELEPAEAKLARTVDHIRIEGERDVVHTVEIRQSDGDSSVLTIGPEISS